MAAIINLYKRQRDNAAAKKSGQNTLYVCYEDASGGCARWGRTMLNRPRLPQLRPKYLRRIQALPYSDPKSI